MKLITETSRLLIREFELSDTSFIIELLNTPGWLAFIGNRQIKTPADAEKYLLNGPLKSYAAFGFGLYAMQLKSSSALIGMCGLLKRETLEDPDLGFAILPDFEGQGFAHEAAAAILHHAAALGLKRILAIVLSENKRSVSLLERLNFVFEKTRMEGEEELMQFALAIKPRSPAQP